ncbi:MULTISPECIES: hypothetical protein [Deinococcus]|uniref:Uncharacterized protein n=2 Tax=Deinococcus TaxID=1298 RepID=H8H306_DEIGI|nr:hypothetical protein [Deinococcus gobiensis]AFD27903.1 hypothetical protein DGo_PC0111 [Deinococcus gobiensis I-0]
MREPYQPTLEEVLKAAASSLRLEGFDTSPERLACLIAEEQPSPEDLHGTSEQRRSALHSR